MHLSFRKLLCVLGLSLLCGSASALTLDWDTVAWTNASLSNSYDIDPVNLGNDITLTVSGNTAQTRLSSPLITTNFQGGLTPAQKTLGLGVDFTNRSQFLMVTVDFSALYALGVQNVSFSIFDIDFDNNAAGPSQYEDQLRSITATGINGVTLIAPTITTSPNNNRTGTGLSQVVTGAVTTADNGPGSGNGNVTISFGTNAIKSFTFIYGSGSGTIADPTYQHIGLHDISFTPVPEINPAWSAVLSCLAVTGLVLRHRATFRK